MRRFLLKLLMYSSPVLIYIIAGELLLLYRYRETVPLNTVIQQQLHSKQELYFFRSFFNMPTSLYKRKMTASKKPDIIALGVSVSLQFRSLLFHPYENRFYNTGFMVNNLDDFGSYIDLLRKNLMHKPKLVIFALDPTWIKQEAIYDGRNNILNPVRDEITHPNLHVKAIQDVMQLTLNPREQNKYFIPYGFGAAATRGNGYRNDGSLNDRAQIDTYLADPKYRDYDYKQHLKNSTFVYAQPMRVSPIKMQTLLRCFEALKVMNIQLIIYFTPIADDFYRYGIHNADYMHIFPTYMQLQRLLLQQHYHVIRFATPRQLGLTDDYMLDAIHPGEVMVSRQFYNYVSKHPDALSSMPGIDINHLKKIVYQHPLCPLSFNGK